MLVIYSSREEVLVTTIEREKDMLDLYFTNGGRSLDDYDRDEMETVQILSKVAVYIG